MPLRSTLPKKSSSTLELPILPFLAPRALAPWLSKGRRVHTGKQTVQKYDANEKNHNIRPSSFENENQHCMEHRSVAAEDHKLPKRTVQLALDEEPKTSESAWENTSDCYEPNPTKLLSTLPGLSHHEFRRQREGIGGSGRRDKVEELQLQARYGTHKNRAFNGPHFRRLGRVSETMIERQDRARAGRARDAIRSRRSADAITWRSAFRGTYDATRQGESEPVVKYYKNSAMGPGLRWRIRIGALQRQQDLAINGTRPKESPPTVFDPLLESLIGHDSSKSLQTAWKALPVTFRIRNWPWLLSRALEKYPTKALKYLVATYTEPLPNSSVVSESLHYIIRHFLHHRSTSEAQSKIALEIFRVARLFLRRENMRHLSIHSVYCLLKHLDNYAAGMLYKFLTEINHPLPKYTLTHFASKLRLSGGPDERMDILDRLWQAGCDFKSPMMSSVCATLLQRKNRLSEVTYSDSEVFGFMLASGLEPDIIIYNILLQNSVEVGDLETAWHIHDMMLQNGIETDAYTYSILLSGSKLHRDGHSVRRVIKIALGKGLLNSHIATDLLHTILLFRDDLETSPEWGQEGQSSKPFRRMLEFYRRYFSSEALVRLVPGFEKVYPDTDLSLALREQHPDSAEGKMKMDPTVSTLVVMLTALFRELTEPLLVVRFYEQFCHLLEARHPVAMALAGSTHVYNIVLMALGRFPETLPLCPRLVGDMLSQTRSGKKNIYPYSNRDRIHPKPDVRTWSILLKIFMDHKQPHAAEKVLKLMQDRAVFPNQVTWNSLIVGYGRLQDMIMTIDTVDRLKKGGYDLDEVSMVGLSYFQNRRALIEAMKNVEAKNPAPSRSDRPAAVAQSIKALNRTLGMFRSRGGGDGLHSFPEPEVNELNKEEGNDGEDQTAAMLDLIEADAEFVVRDLPDIDEEAVDLDERMYK